MERINYVDFIKGAAIIAVVFAHISCFEGWQLLPIKSLFAYTWHVGVFFIVSGFFLIDVDTSNVKGFLLRKTKQLYLLALYFYLPAVLLHNVMLQIGWYEMINPNTGNVMAMWNLSDFVKQAALSICCAGQEPIVGALWFVYVLFFAMIVYACISLIINNIYGGGEKYLLLVFFILAVVSGILSNKAGININRCSNVFTAILLIYSGKCLFQNLKLQFDNSLLAIASAVMLYEISVMYRGFDLSNNKFTDIAALMAGCLSALYTIAYIGRKVEGSIIERFIRYCGKQSFYIMALHRVGFKLCTMSLSLFNVDACRLSDLQPTTGNDIPLTLIYIAFGILFPLLFMWTFRKAKAIFVQLLLSIKLI